jgi:hypothetical protein
MRRFVYWGIFGCLFGAGACISLAPQGSVAQIPDMSTRDPAAADRALIAFGEAHPHCLIWTNWQKLCSRTGVDGAIHCTADPDRAVEPSEPFCAGAAAPHASSSFRGNFDRARESSLRFCESRWPGSEAEAVNEGETTLCNTFAGGRPFNGRRIAAMRHPWCQVWSDALTGDLVCSEHGGNGTPSCSGLAARHYEHPHLLSCSEWVDAVPCSRPVGGTPRRTPAGGHDRAIVGGIPNPEGSAVWGTFCTE